MKQLIICIALTAVCEFCMTLGQRTYRMGIMLMAEYAT
jgi:hypothetical protein